jgi:TonB family protein
MKTLPLLLASLAVALPAIARDAAPAGYESLKIVKATDIIFPQQATQLGARDGEARVIIQVDETGALTDWLVTSYTLPVFAERAVNAVKQWKFEPARVRGEPRSSVTELSFIFSTKGIVVTDLSLSSYVAMRDYQLRPEAYAYKVCALHELDRIPVPSKIVQPAFPAEFVPKGSPVSIDVEFYIDEQGHVRLPSVSRETNQAHAVLGAAAVTAVAQWNFEPPMSHGRPVLVYARQEFKFQPAPAVAPMPAH